MNKRIGFDIHGVIDKNPPLFRKIINDLKHLGYEIHILTGSLPTKNLLDELKEYKIEYDFLFSILEHHKSKGTNMWKDDRGWWVDDDIWNKTKAEYCDSKSFLFHLDDTKVYGDYFNTPFGHITPLIEKPRILEIKGDIDDEIIEILKKYEGYYKIKFI